LKVPDREQDKDSTALSKIRSVKRTHETEQKVGAKRVREEQHLGEQSDTHQTIGMHSTLQSALDRYISPLFDLPYEFAGTSTELLVPNVWPSDFFNLNQRMWPR
jgi:hypothetical protein